MILTLFIYVMKYSLPTIVISYVVLVFLLFFFFLIYIVYWKIPTILYWSINTVLAIKYLGTDVN